jgi:arginine repressor
MSKLLQLLAEENVTISLRDRNKIVIICKDEDEAETVFEELEALMGDSSARIVYTEMD